MNKVDPVVHRWPSVWDFVDWPRAWNYFRKLQALC